ncbi:MAG: Rrf2 family transcriptional regulator [Candidatus Omnitrophica bacterium]|nr:Rrf2 family transcriptional regulator [Candidatus Omnitrophota bacterium]
MKLITRDTDYAIRSVCFIAKNKKEIVSAAELTDALKIPRPFLRKILQVLDKKGVLKSYKGSGGGFSLGKPADKIFLFDLMKIFQGDFSLNECFLKKIPCPNRGRCVLRRSIKKIEKSVIRQLKPISISSILG